MRCWCCSHAVCQPITGARRQGPCQRAPVRGDGCLCWEPCCQAARGGGLRPRRQSYTPFGSAFRRAERDADCWQGLAESELMLWLHSQTELGGAAARRRDGEASALQQDAELQMSGASRLVRRQARLGARATEDPSLRKPRPWAKLQTRSDSWQPAKAMQSGKADRRAHGHSVF